MEDNKIHCRKMGSQLPELNTRDNFVEINLSYEGFGQRLSLMLHRSFMTILCTSGLFRDF